MLDGPVSDQIEGEALSYALDKVDVFSASWGPNDNGEVVDGPGRIAQLAFLKGISKVWVCLAVKPVELLTFWAFLKWRSGSKRKGINLRMGFWEWRR